MLIRKLLKGHYFIRAVSITNLGNDTAEIRFHKMGKWSIFGFREYHNPSYIRKHYWKWTDKLQNKSKFTVCSSFNLIQYYFKTPNEVIYSWLLDLLIWIWIGYAVVSWSMK